MASVRLTRSAETDLLEAWVFISEESPEAADRVLDVIDKEAQTLALQPLMGRARPELSPGLRCWPTSMAYNLYYFPEAEGITIVRVLHHARDVQSRAFMGQ
jgi:plasmid stabilization system protein ParE